MPGPIVFIHGIKGAHLAQTYDDSFDTIWSGVQSRFETIWDLTLADNGEVDADEHDLIIVQQLESIAYSEFLGKLRSCFKEPIYIFRYDWRLDNLENAKRLDVFLELIRKKTGAVAYRFATHSMGGLVLSAFIQLNQKKNLSRIERAVLSATPFWGSCESMRSLVVGDAQRFFFFSSEAFRKIARTFPSVYQLVPGYQKSWIHPQTGASTWDYNYWQKRIDAPKAVMKVNAERDVLMEKHLLRAQAFHTKDVFDFTKLNQENADKFLFMHGSGENTLVSLKVLPNNSAKDVEYFFDFENSTYDISGDGTVPVVSAKRYADSKVQHLEINLKDQSSWWLPSTWDDKLKSKLAGFHGGFLALDKVQGLVRDWLDFKKVKTTWQDKIKP